MGVRGWPAWLGLWSLAVVGTMFALAAREAADLPAGGPSGEPDQVSATASAIAAVPYLAVLLLFFLVGLSCWRRSPRATRLCLVVGAGGLGWAAYVVRGIPDLGPWYPGGLAIAAAVALLGAVLGTGAVTEPSRVAGVLASVGLAAVGAVVAVLGWRGLEYQGWFWYWSVTGPMWAAMVVGALLVVLGLVGRRLPDRWWTAAPAMVVLLGAALVTLTLALSWMGWDSPLLDRHEESESGWEKMPHLLAGAGFLAAATAVAFRWWSTAAVSVVVGCLLAAGQVVRDPGLWRFIT